jgi:ribosomal protein S18 acetylase RimI-like enzyme
MFRSANFDDLPALRSLYALCFSSDDETLGRIASTGLEEIGQGRTILVHERDGQIVGFLEAEEVFQQHHMITRLAVHPDFRRSRVATRLLDKILDNGRATDTVISLIVQADDYLVLKLALSLGFMAHSTVPDSSVTKSVRLYLRYHSEHRGQIRRNETFQHYSKPFPGQNGCNLRL